MRFNQTTSLSLSLSLSLSFIFSCRQFICANEISVIFRRLQSHCDAVAVLLTNPKALYVFIIHCCICLFDRYIISVLLQCLQNCVYRMLSMVRIIHYDIFFRIFARNKRRNREFSWYFLYCKVCFLPPNTVFTLQPWGFSFFFLTLSILLSSLQ